MDTEEDRSPGESQNRFIHLDGLYLQHLSFISCCHLPRPPSPGALSHFLFENLGVSMTKLGVRLVHSPTAVVAPFLRSLLCFRLEIPPTARLNIESSLDESIRRLYPSSAARLCQVPATGQPECSPLNARCRPTSPLRRALPSRRADRGQLERIRPVRDVGRLGRAPGSRESHGGPSSDKMSRNELAAWAELIAAGVCSTRPQDAAGTATTRSQRTTQRPLPLAACSASE